MSSLRDLTRSDDQRRFKEGDAFEVSGVRFRVCTGTKGPDDLVLKWQLHDGRWAPILFDAAFLMADFFYENEEALYPSYRPNNQGGEKFRCAVFVAVKYGWREASRRVALERQQRRQRQERVST